MLFNIINCLLPISMIVLIIIFLLNIYLFKRKNWCLRIIVSLLILLNLYVIVNSDYFKKNYIAKKEIISNNPENPKKNQNVEVTDDPKEGPKDDPREEQKEEEIIDIASFKEDNLDIFIDEVNAINVVSNTNNYYLVDYDKSLIDVTNTGMIIGKQVGTTKINLMLNNLVADEITITIKNTRKGIGDVTVDEVRNTVVNFAKELVENNVNDFIYSGYYKDKSGNSVYASRNAEAYKGIRYANIKVYGTSNNQIYTNGIAGRSDWKGKRFVLECIGFGIFVIRHSTKLGDNNYTNYWFNSGFQAGNIKSLVPGDFLSFGGHYAIYVGKIKGMDMMVEINNISYPYSWSIRLTNVYNNLQAVSRFTTMQENVNYNKIFSENSLWAKLDTTKPEFESVIKNNDNTFSILAIDRTNDNLIDTNGNGVNGYMITRDNVEPTFWHDLTFNNNLEYTKSISFITPHLDSGTYYLWIKDRGGNTNNYILTI